MKYIRTKDGRMLKVFQDNVSLCQENDGLAYYGKETVDFETSCYLPKSQILKQANTIEELFDEIVYINAGVGYFLVGGELDKAKADQYETYGAIWTKWGLRFVAKLTEKGWELL